MTHSLLFDDTLELIGSGTMATSGYWFETLTGTSWGNAQPIEVAINSLLRDGALVETQGDDNREVNVVVRIKAADGAALDEGIAALNRSTRKRTTLMWTPPDGYAEPHVFEVETSNLLAPDDFDDLAWKRNEQVYRLRLVCFPYWRARELTTEVAEGIPSIGTVINSCQSTTGWTAHALETGTYGLSPAPSPMIAVDSADFVEGTGSIAIMPYRGEGPGGTANGVRFYSYDHSAFVAVADYVVPAGSYFSFAAKFTESFGYYSSSGYETATVGFGFSISAGTSPSVGEPIVTPLSNGWNRYTYKVSTGFTLSGIAFSGTQYRAITTGAPYPLMKIDQIAVAASATLGKQALKTIVVGGSARTTGALHVAAPSDVVPLGQVVAFTIPKREVSNAFRPDLRQWRTSGTTVTDSSAPSGSYFNSIGNIFDNAGAPILQAPASLFRPGAYTMVATIRHDTTASRTLDVEATLMIGGVEVASAIIGTTYTPAASGVWFIQPLGTIYLPPVAVMSPSTSSVVRFRVRSSNDVALDELHVFPVSGDLTIVDCGSGTVSATGSSSHLWIDSPSAEQPQGGYWRGASPTRVDSVAAWSTTLIPGVHSFEAGEMLAYVSSSKAAGPSASLDYYKRRL